MPALGGTARRLAQDAYYPSWSPDGKKIVYQALRDGEWGLRIQDVDGTGGEKALSLGGLKPRLTMQPAWCPDGQWIAFTAGPVPLRIYTVLSEGGDARALTPPESSALLPSWSADGQWLFFSSDRAGQLNLWKARFQNGRLGTPRQLTAGSGPDIQAQLDPTGKRLAYSSLRAASDLWEYHLDSKRANQLTSETTQEENARPSPDGAFLAFASNRLNGNHLWLLNHKDGSLTQVTTTPYPDIQVPSYWSWDGKYLFYASSGGDRQLISKYEVATGSSQKVYEGQPAGAGSILFCLSPDDRYLVIPARGRIARVELASGKQELLVQPAEGSAGDADCSPDGQWVAFQVQRGNGRKIWLVPLAGGPARQLTFGQSEDSHPAWSADSRWVYFLRNHQDIYVVSRDGGEPKPVTHFRSFSIALDYPTATRDSKRLLFTRTDKTGDIFILANPPD
jgi:Tol biopolymer transport system component